MSPTKGAALLSGFDTTVVAAEEAKASAAGTEEKKAARQAKGLAELLGSLGGYDTVQASLVETAESLGGKVADLFDTEEGNKVADRIKRLLDVDPEDQPQGFDVEVASDLLKRWKGATGRRGTGDGSSKSDPLPCPVKVVFTYPEGSEVKMTDHIRHTSTWSSVSAEVTKRAIALDGGERDGKYKRPESADTMWKEAKKAIKDGGVGGKVVVPTKSGNMVAVLTADRG